jgi:uncharacterized protein YbjQ (UPF0145 family)
MAKPVWTLTTNTVPGHTIVDAWTMIWALSSREDDLDDLLERVKEHARECGANAIVGLRIVPISEVIGHGRGPAGHDDVHTEVTFLVYGTPVMAEAK